MMSALYSDIYDVMMGLKQSMLRLKSDDMLLSTFPKIKSWGIGYVFQETIHPTISLFPISKSFLGKRSGGQEVVQYRISADIYAKRRLNPNQAKGFTFDVADDIKRAIKKSIRTIGKSGEANSFHVTIEHEDFFEPVEGSDSFYSSSASLQIMCQAYYQMNTNRITQTVIKEADYDAFFNEVVKLLKDEVTTQGLSVRAWVDKTAKGTIGTPAVVILPGNEYVQEHLTNGYVWLARPLQIHVLSSGYPKVTLLKNNIKLTDKLMLALEKHYMVSGYAQQFEAKSIEYESPKKSGYTFQSTINVEFRSRVRYTTEYK